MSKEVILFRQVSTSGHLPPVLEMKGSPSLKSFCGLFWCLIHLTFHPSNLIPDFGILASSVSPPNPSVSSRSRCGGCLVTFPTCSSIPGLFSDISFCLRRGGRTIDCLHFPTYPFFHGEQYFQNFNGLRHVRLIKPNGVVISPDQYRQLRHKTNTCPSGPTAAPANQLKRK